MVSLLISRHTGTKKLCVNSRAYATGLFSEDSSLRNADWEPIHRKLHTGADVICLFDLQSSSHWIFLIYISIVTRLTASPPNR